MYIYYVYVHIHNPPTLLYVTILYITVHENEKEKCMYIYI